MMLVIRGGRGTTYLLAGCLALLLADCRPAPREDKNPGAGAKVTESGRDDVVEPAPPPGPGESAAALPAPRYGHWGARWSEEATQFRVHAPMAREISVWIYRNAMVPMPDAEFVLMRTSDGSFEGERTGNLDGHTYCYVLRHDDGRTSKLADPFATHLVANGTRCLIVRPGASDPPGWRNHARPKPPASPLDTIIYETHVRDFTMHAQSGATAKGSYLGFAESPTTIAGKPGGQPTGLDYLKYLGVTHIHLMPVMEFENDEAKRGYNWGYMTSGWFSPEGMFASNPDNGSRVTELKQLIMATHAHGIGVIMDVVFNHAGHSSPLQALGGPRYFRTWPDGKWSNASHCGNDLKTEDPWVREFILQSLEYWTREYAVDGFRFDLMGMIDAETMRQASTRLRAINPGIILYGEPWMSGQSPFTGPCADKSGLRSLPGIAAFNDDIRNALKGPPKGNEPGFIMDGSHKDHLMTGISGQQNWGLASPANILNYMTAHDDLVLADKLALAMPASPVEERRARVMQGIMILLTSQGIPFLHSGCEFLRSKNGNDNSHNGGDPVNAIDWSLLEDHAMAHRWTRALITIRKEHPVFRLGSYEEIRQRLRFHHSEKPGVLVFTIRGDGLAGESWKEVMIAINTSATTPVSLDMPDGTWKIRLDSRREQKEPIAGKTTLPPLAAWLAIRE